MVSKFEQHQSKVIEAHTKRKMISIPQPKQTRKKGRDKKTGTTMAGRFECVTKVKHEYKSRLGALVEVVGEAS